MKDDCLGAVVVTAHIIHGDILIHLRIRLGIRNSFLGRVRASSIDVDGSFLPLIESLILLQTQGQNLVIAFQEVTNRAEGQLNLSV